jgi:hypothetical protein
MDTHTLIAKTPEGRRIELGRVGSLEAAARLRARLASELGDEYAGFEILESDQLELPLEPAFVEVLHVARSRSQAELMAYLDRIAAQL